MSDRSTDTQDARRGGRRIIRLPDVKNKTGLSSSSIWRRVDADPTFPKPREIGPNAVGWFEDEIDDWLESRPISRPEKVPA